jgi:uncharacterized ParB-like nuclease family protein
MKILNIKNIRTDGETQARSEINSAAVAEYTEAIKGGSEFPPVVVFHDGAEYWLADGFHRFHAHRDAGNASIHAEVKQGTQRDAILYSLGANATHGLRRTNADKRKAVETLLQDFDWSEWSDRKIAEVCGVGHPFVASIRTPLIASKQQENRAASASKKAAAVESDSTPIATLEQTKPALSIVQAIAPEDEYTPLDAANDTISGLQDSLAAAILGNVSDEDKTNAQALIADLRARIKTLEATLKAVTISRDTYQNENAELKKQINRQRREIDRATGLKTA